MEFWLFGMLIFSIAIATWKIVDRLDRIARALENAAPRASDSAASEKI
jgi:hypothetical protein